MRKILFVITKNDVGGAQKYVKDLADNLNSKQFEVKIITGGNHIKFLSNSFHPHYFFLNDLLALAELFFVFRREKPDVIHLNSSKAGVIGALAAFLYRVKCQMSNVKCPKVVFTAHGWVFNPTNALSGLRRSFYIELHKLAALFQDKVINVSEFDRQLAMKHSVAPTYKLVTIRNGIKLSGADFLAKDAARRELVEKLKIVNWKLEIDKKWIGSIGRLVVEKDYATLVQAARQVPDAKFFILGDGYERKKLELLITNCQLQNRFFIVGGIAPAAKYLKAFDIFVLPSIKEGLPYTLIEAMAAGVPVVVTRVGGMTEIIEGRGLVMPPRQPEEIARAVNHYLDHPEEAKKLSLSAKRFFEENLTLARMVRETEKIYI